MPQNTTEGIRRLAGQGASLSAQDYAGMSPRQMLAVAQQKEQERSSTAQMLHNINQQKLQEAKAKISASLNVKKQRLQEKKAEALNNYRRKRTDFLRNKLNRLEMKEQLTQKLSELQVKTNFGSMSALQAKVLSDAGMPIEDEAAGEYSLKLTDFGGKEYAISFNPTTGEVSKTALGPVTQEEEDPAKHETLAGKLDEAEQTLTRYHGASELTGLKPEAKEKFAAGSLLHQNMLREDEKLEGKEAAIRAGRQVDRFDDTLKGAIVQTTKDQIIESLVPVVKKARKLYNASGSYYFHPSKVIDRLVDAGWSPQEARDIVDQAREKAFSKE